MKTFSRTPGNEVLYAVDCPVCGSKHFTDHWSCDGFKFVKCDSCSVIYQNPRPAQDALIGRYDDEYFEYEIENERQFYKLMRLALSDIDFGALTANFPDSGRTFLDIGCATGLLIHSLSGEGWKARGVEVCAPAARYGIEHRGVEIHIGTLEAAGFEPESFGVVHCSHLIEHLTDPASFIREVLRILRPDGLFLVSTPNASGFQARLFGHRWRSAIADHMVLFSKKTLKRALENRYFDVINIKTWGGIAAGLAPGWIKKPLDIAAKRFGFGDVMIQAARKRSG